VRLPFSLALSQLQLLCVFPSICARPTDEPFFFRNRNKK
jgi:hypothetical protein